MRVGIMDSTREDTHGRKRTAEALEQHQADVVVFHPFDVVLRFSEEPNAVLLGGRPLDEQIDVCLVRRTRGAVATVADIVRLFTQRGIPCVDPLMNYISPLSKASCLIHAADDVAVPKTVLLGALEMLNHIGWDDFPCIVKPVEGFQGRDVKLAKTPDELRSHVRDLVAANRRAMVQEWLLIKDEFRVTVVGTDVVAVCRKHPATKGAVAWNFAQGATFELVDRPDLHAIALRIAERSQCQICGVDLIETHEKVHLLEANRCPGFEAVEACGVDVAGKIAELLVKMVTTGTRAG